MRTTLRWLGSVSGAAALVLTLGMSESLAQQDTAQAPLPETQQDTAQVENEVTVTLRDGEIELPDSLEAGTIMFTVVNEGTQEHSLVIEGKDVGETRIDPGQQPPPEEELPPEEEEEYRAAEGEFMESIGRNLSVGESSVLVTTLAPGEYVAWCPVDDHREQGMEVTFTVKEPGMEVGPQ